MLVGEKGNQWFANSQTLRATFGQRNDQEQTMPFMSVGSPGQTANVSVQAALQVYGNVFPGSMIVCIKKEFPKSVGFCIRSSWDFFNMDPGDEPRET